MGTMKKPNSREEEGYKETSTTMALGKEETKWVNISRILMVIVLLGVAIAVSIVMYRTSRQDEHEAFERYFQAAASKISSEFNDGSERRLSVIQDFAGQLTTYALATNSSWPNVVLPDFEKRSQYALGLSDMLSIIFFPLVDKATRNDWEKFSVENQGWLVEGLELQGIPEEDWDTEMCDIIKSTWGETTGLSIPTEIFRLNGTERTYDTTNGPYAPWWQTAPSIACSSLVNYNAFSHPTRNAAMSAVVELQQPIITQAWDYSDINASSTIGKKAVLNMFLLHGNRSTEEYEYGPVSDLYVPVFGSFEDDAAIEGQLSSYLYWTVYFENILVEEDSGVYVVLENTCGQEFTYLVHGPDAIYLSAGDLHDAKYDHLMVETGYDDLYSGVAQDLKNDTDVLCQYHIRIYPTVDMEDHFMTGEPLHFALIMVATFVFTCIVFLCYDFFVQTRQFVVMTEAQQSDKIVAAMFPEQVRARLYESGRMVDSNKKEKTHFLSSSKSSTTTPTAPKLEAECMAIADLYPNCTVSFMDLVGFTRWSSTRQPSQVFKLLETLYKAFDKTAQRLDVFKVETIGDCYVAATGIPYAQPDHAILMARFAADALVKVSQVTQALAGSLGESTLDLTIRAGMHSGPVTAGVLRGDKARFQLFGDTVLKAASMESSGTPGQVQLSEETAELLRYAAKGDWVQQNDTSTFSKDAVGETPRKTFWLRLQHVESMESTSSESDEISDEIGGEN